MSQGGKSPLLVASEKGHVEAVSALIAAGASVDLVDKVLIK